MEGFDTVRKLARRRHDEACAAAGGKKSAIDLLDGATAITGIERIAVADDDPVLWGAEAVLDPSACGIFYKESVSVEQAVFYQAHEFGHHFLDSATGACGGFDIDATMPEERIPLGIQRVDGYGPRERRECQANVFAREFLLPCSEARRLFSRKKLSAADIAKRIGAPIGLVHQQLAQALLVPEIDSSENAPVKMPALDASQKVAAEAEAGPHLIEAGPGTGKTRTLIARIEWLLERGVDPTSILVLDVFQQGGRGIAGAGRGVRSRCRAGDLGRNISRIRVGNPAQIRRSSRVGFACTCCRSWRYAALAGGRAPVIAAETLFATVRAGIRLAGHTDCDLAREG